MTSKTSLFKGGIFRYNLKLYGWIAALHGLLLFLLVPFQILSEDKAYYIRRLNENPEFFYSPLLNGGNGVFGFILIVGAAVILSVCVMRYLQRVRSVTLFHALPTTRTQIYVTATLSGMVLLFLPVLLNGLILIFMNLFGGYDLIMPLGTIFSWIARQLLTGAAVLCFGIFVGIFTGSSVAQFAFVFILCGVPFCILSLVSFTLDNWLFGFSQLSLSETQRLLAYLMPIYPHMVDQEPIWWSYIMYGVYILIFSLGGLFFYHKRDTERAGDVVAFPWLKPVFLYGVTFCVMMAGYGLISSITGKGSSPNLITLLLFALLGYAGARILLTKSFRIARYYKGYVVFGALVILLYCVVDFNLLGYGHFVPEREDVQFGCVGYYVQSDWNEEIAMRAGSNDVAYLMTTESIEALISLHEEFVEAGKVEGLADGVVRERIVIAYQLESGRSVVRSYYGDRDKIYALFSLPDAKDSMFPNLRKTPEKIQDIVIQERSIYGTEKEELIAALQADIESLGYKELVGVRPYDEKLEHYSLLIHVPAEDIEGKQTQRTHYFSFNSYYKETIAWLDANQSGWRDRK